MTTKTVIANVVLFDGHDLSPGPQTVIVENGLITSVIPASDFPHVVPSPTTTIIDGTAHTLLPGLIDAHVHANNAAALHKFARHGVTTVLDMGNVKPLSDLRDLLSPPPSTDGEPAGSPLPTYRTSGLFASHPNSRHAKMFGLPPEKTVSSPAEAASFAAARAAEGASYLKVIADLPGFDTPTLKALTDAAREAGLLSIAHAARDVSYKRAADAGFDVLTHAPTNAALDASTVEMIKEKGIVVVPTLGMMGDMVPVLRKMVPEGSFSLDTAVENVRTLVEAGIRMCVGTDSNEQPMLAREFGSSVWDEMELMARAGLTNLDVLRAATETTAKVWGLEGWGSIRAGCRADLVLVEGNPAEDLAALRRLKKVWIGGTTVPDVLGAAVEMLPA